MARTYLSQIEAKRRSALVSNVTYDIALDLSAEPSDETFKSTTTISFDGAKRGETFLSLIAERVSKITLNGREIDLSAFVGERISLKDIKAGPNVVTIEADCRYSRDGIGLHRTIDSDGNVYCYTKFEPDYAHQVFPCFDQPDLKATFAFHVTAPPEWVVVSNSGMVRQATAENSAIQDADCSQRISGGKQVVDFAPSPPLPTYLSTLGAGNYVVLEDTYHGKPLRWMSRQSLRSRLEKHKKWLFDASKECLGNLETMTGYAYPFAHYTNAFVEGFPSGAMENAAFVTYNESMLPGDIPTTSQLFTTYKVIAHEGVHEQGNGNVVTPQWWDALPLNESFATFNSYLLMAQSRDFADISWIAFNQIEKADALEADQYSTTHAIAAAIRSTEETKMTFDRITYSKGAAVLCQLYALLGHDDFVAGLQLYLQRYRWKTATTHDFLQAMSDATGRDIVAWGREWWETPGVNTLSPKLRIARNRLQSLVIEQRADASAQKPRGGISKPCATLRTHRLRVGIYDLQNDKLEKRCILDVEVKGKKTATTDPRVIGQTAPALVVVNDEDLTYAKVRFDEASLAMLGDKLQTIAEPLTRTVIWASLYDQVRDGELSASEYVEMVKNNLGTEKQSLIMKSTLQTARIAITRFAAPNHQTALHSSLFVLALDASEKASKGSDLQTEWLLGAVDTATSDADLETLSKLLDGSKNITGIDVVGNNDIRWRILSRLVAKGKADQPEIDAECQRNPNDPRNPLIVAALAASRPTLAAKDAAWAQVMQLKASLAMVRAIAMGASVGGKWIGGFHQPGQDDLSTQFVDRYFAAVSEFWDRRSPDVAKVFTSNMYPGNVNNATVVNAAERAVDSESLPYGAWRLITESLDNTQRAIKAQATDRSTSDIALQL